MFSKNSTGALKERLNYLSNEIKIYQKEEAEIIAELIRRVPSDSIPGSSSANSDAPDSTGSAEAQAKEASSSSDSSYQPIITNEGLASALKAAVSGRSISSSDTREAFRSSTPKFAGVSDIASLKDVQVKDRVYITNSLSHRTNDHTKDRSATVTKVNYISRRVYIRTDSGVSTFRAVRNLKFLQES